MNRHTLTFFNDYVLIDYTNSKYLHYYSAQKTLYSKIKMCKFVPKMEFLNQQIQVSLKGKSLDKLNCVSISDKKIIKQNLIEFIRYLNNAKIAHRDLWIKNVCWDGKQIWVIDWEYIINHSPNTISEHYDLTGEGEDSPEQTCKMNIFHKHHNSLSKWLYPVILTREEF
jgi:thiamine kinase-like enzyme